METTIVTNSTKIEEHDEVNEQAQTSSHFGLVNHR